MRCEGHPHIVVCVIKLGWQGRRVPCSAGTSGLRLHTNVRHLCEHNDIEQRIVLYTSLPQCRAQKTSLWSWALGSACSIISECYEIAQLSNIQQGGESQEAWDMRKLKAQTEINKRLITLIHAIIQVCYLARCPCLLLPPAESSKHEAEGQEIEGLDRDQQTPHHTLYAIIQVCHVLAPCSWLFLLSAGR